MTEEMRNALTPQEYIRQLFTQTKDGWLSISRHPLFDQSYTRRDIRDY